MQNFQQSINNFDLPINKEFLKSPINLNKSKSRNNKLFYSKKTENENKSNKSQKSNKSTSIKKNKKINFVNLLKINQKGKSYTEKMFDLYTDEIKKKNKDLSIESNFYNLSEKRDLSPTIKSDSSESDHFINPVQNNPSPVRNIKQMHFKE